MAAGLPGGIAAIRPLRAPDVPRLAQVYRESIRHVGLRHYSPSQVTAWSALGDDMPAFREWLQAASTWVAEDDTSLCVGFAGLQVPGRIASLFVAPEFMGQGVGTTLVRHLLSELAREDVKVATTEASEFSRPVFERCGFRVTAVEHTHVRGVAFTRYVMQLDGPTG